MCPSVRIRFHPSKIYIYIYTYIYVYVYVYVCIYTYISLSLYIYTYIYTHKHIFLTPHTVAGIAIHTPHFLLRFPGPADCNHCNCTRKLCQRLY